MRVRAVTQGDAKAIAAMLDPLVTERMNVVRGPLTAEDHAAWIATLPEGALYLTAEGDDGIVGLTDLLPVSQGEAEITTVVAADHHRKGVGKALVAELRAQARDAGYQRLWATLRPGAVGAIRFYTQLGFHVVEREPNRVRARLDLVLYDEEPTLFG